MSTSNFTNAQASMEFLSSADDLLTRLLLDYAIFEQPKLDGRSTGKTNLYTRLTRFEDKEVEDARDLVQELREGSLPVHTALDTLLQFPSVRAFNKKWDDEPLFSNHAKRYIMALRPDSGIAFHETDRYKNPFATGKFKGAQRRNRKAGEIAASSKKDPSSFIEVGVFATKSFRKGEVVNLRGGVADLTDEQDDELRGENGRSEFSVLWSQRKQCFCLLLGPARFTNHDCRNNVEFQLVGANMSFKVLEDIAADEELFTHYGEHYFDHDNAACLCATCEQLEKGAFAPPSPKPTKTSARRASSPPLPPSRRSSRATLAINYNENGQALPVASGSGHSLTAQRSLRTGLSRSSSLSSLSTDTSSSSSSPRRASSRTTPSRVAPSRVSPIDALRGQPRTVIQPKLKPPPGYLDQYDWDYRRRKAIYVGPIDCEEEEPKPKPAASLSRSASAPSTVSLKRKRSVTDSPQPKGKGKAKVREPGPPKPKRARQSLVQLKTVRLGERSSKRVAGGSASARDRTFAKLRQAMGEKEAGDDSDLSSLEESEETELVGAPISESELTEASEEDSAEEAAEVAALLSPRNASPRNASPARSSSRLSVVEDALPFSMPGLHPLSSSAPTASVALTSTSYARPPRSSRSVSACTADVGNSTSTPAEPPLSPQLTVDANCKDPIEVEDSIVLVPVRRSSREGEKTDGADADDTAPTPTRRSPHRSIATPSFYSAAAASAGEASGSGSGSNATEGGGGEGSASSAAGQQDFRLAPSSGEGGETNDSTVESGGEGGSGGGSSGGGGGGSGGGGGGDGGGDDERAGERRKRLPVDKMDLEEEQEKLELDEKAGKDDAALAEEHAAATDPEDVAAALLMLLSGPISLTPALTPALTPTSTSPATSAPRDESSVTSSSTGSSIPAGALSSNEDSIKRGKRKRMSEASQPSPPPSLNPRSTRRQPKLPSPLPAVVVALSSSKPASKKARTSAAPVEATSSNDASASAPRTRNAVAARSAAGSTTSAGLGSPQPEVRRTRSQPLPGKLEDVLYAPEALAATGGFDFAKGRYISKLEALRAPSNDPRPPPRPTPPASPVATPQLPPSVKPLTSARHKGSVPTKRSRLSHSPATTPMTSSSKAAFSARSSAPPASASPSSSAARVALPEGVRSTRKSFPIAQPLRDLIYSPEILAASGGYDPVKKAYVSASNASSASSSGGPPHPLPLARRSASASTASRRVSSPATPVASASGSGSASAPSSSRSTRKSFPLSGTIADLVYGEAARSAAGGWDPKLGRYVSAAKAAKAASPANGDSASSVTSPGPIRRRTTSASAPPAVPTGGGRSTRKSFPMDGTKLEDIVYGDAARGACGGWDPVAGVYRSKVAMAKVASAAEGDR
ncbi:hypothetical protein JCM11641_005788 [Rhodosporidiobolus odoratus]